MPIPVAHGSELGRGLTTQPGHWAERLPAALAAQTRSVHGVITATSAPIALHHYVGTEGRIRTESQHRDFPGTRVPGLLGSRNRHPIIIERSSDSAILGPTSSRFRFTPMERYADQLDLAQAHVECEIALRIAALRHRTHEGQGRDDCMVCGSLIPDARRRHIPNATRCAPCQDQAERGQGPVRRAAM